MHRVSAVPAKKGVPSRLAVDEAAAAPLRDGPSPTVIPLNTATIVGGTGVVDEVAGRWRHRRGLSDLCVVLIHGVTAGFEGPECNLGDRERFKVSRGNKRRRSAEAKLWIVPGAERPGCVEDPPSDDGDQNDKQRSCFWWAEASH